MSGVSTIKSIEQAALQLQPGARARIAQRLIESLGELSPDQLETLWLDEAERRDQEMESGRVTGVAGEEVFTRLHAKHDK